MIPRDWAQAFGAASIWDRDRAIFLLIDLLFDDLEGLGPAWAAINQTGALSVDSESAAKAVELIFQSAKQSVNQKESA